MYPSPVHPFSDFCIISSSLLFRDTVNSVGLVPRRLPFTTSNSVVRKFRHAVSLDERRAKFKANLWNRPTKSEELLSITDQKVAEAADILKKGKSNSHHHEANLHALEGKYAKLALKPTDVDEVSTGFILIELCLEN